MGIKTEPLGICDHCKGPIRGSLFTSKHHPRRYCSRLCRNTANSRAGAGKRSDKAKARIQAGEWSNPARGLTPDIIRQAAKMGGAARAITLKEDVAAGTWQSPSLSQQARANLSRPRKHRDDAVLHAAIEKLSRGLHMADLTPDEATRYRTYRRELAMAKRPQAPRLNLDTAIEWSAL